MKLLLSVILCFAMGCKSVQTKNSTSHGEELPFQTISSGSLFGNGAEGITKSNSIITEATQWDSLVKKLTVENNSLLDLKKIPIDFSEEMLICSFDALRVTGGFAIKIERLSIEKDRINIYYNTQKPSPGEMVSMVITQPYHIVKTAKREGVPVFIKIEN